MNNNQIESEHVDFYNRLTDQARMNLHSEVIAAGVAPAMRRSAMIWKAFEQKTLLSYASMVQFNTRKRCFKPALK